MKGTYWLINTRGTVSQSPKSGRKYVARKEFGNCFSSQRLAKIARERMIDLFKRVKVRK